LSARGDKDHKSDGEPKKKTATKKLQKKGGPTHFPEKITGERRNKKLPPQQYKTGEQGGDVLDKKPCHKQDTERRGPISRYQKKSKRKGKRPIRGLWVYGGDGKHKY